MTWAALCLSVSGMATESRIGVRIKRARERKRMRQQDLAAAVGVSRTTVDAWEHNRAYPRNRIGALEEVLGISLDDAPALDGLTGTDEWEDGVLADTEMSEELRVAIVRGSRAARAEYVRRKRELRAARERRESARSDHGTSAG